jgi:saccharopine dehydrogenase-like NADP-dependent oxidoreductase
MTEEITTVGGVNPGCTVGSGRLYAMMDKNFDVVLDFFPPHHIRAVAEAAIASGVHLVNTNYAYDILDLDHAAKKKGMPSFRNAVLIRGLT